MANSAIHANTVLLKCLNNSGRVSSSISNNSVTLSIAEEDITIEGQKGTLEYEWRKQVLDEELEPHWEVIPEATTNEYKITAGDGIYSPVVKNNCNGSVYTFELNSVVVNDTAT